LTKAELCKNQNESQQLDLDMAKIKEDSALDNTMIDESNINTEKKQQSSAPQNCCLQWSFFSLLPIFLFHKHEE
jgi:hypothetical protein